LLKDRVKSNTLAAVLTAILPAVMGIGGGIVMKSIKSGAKIVKHSKYVTFQMAEVAIDKMLFTEILSRIERLRCYSV